MSSTAVREIPTRSTATLQTASEMSVLFYGIKLKHTCKLHPQNSVPYSATI